MMMRKIDSFAGERILVTGASGFIGGELCVKLKERGAEIHAVSREKRKASEVIDRWIQGDLVNSDFTRSTVSNSKPDKIFHLAGFVSGQRDLEAVRPAYKNNLTATINMLTAATEVGVQGLTLAGSMEEHQMGSEEFIPVSPYAASKWASSGYARMFYKLYGTPVSVPRIYMVYGPGKQNYEKVIPYVILSLLNQKKPKLTNGKRLIDWIYIDDVVEGLMRMAKTEGIEGKTIELGSGKQHSVQEICNKIVSIMDSDIQLEFGEKPDRVFERDHTADLSLANEYLQWEAQTNIDEGLKETVEWFKNTSL